jgi:probable rRNA maturation factor
MTLSLRNRQRDCPLDLRLLRRILRFALERSFSVREYELCFHFVPVPEMADVNEKFLNHTGPTDVITFDHSEVGRAEQTGSLQYGGLETCATDSRLHGEIFICPKVAVGQAREFRTSWQEEVVRYCVHGLLHLCGYDDVRTADRRKMKREEGRVVNELTQQFAVARLSRARLK